MEEYKVTLEDKMEANVSEDDGLTLKFLLSQDTFFFVAVNMFVLFLVTAFAYVILLFGSRSCWWCCKFVCSKIGLLIFDQVGLGLPETKYFFRMVVKDQILYQEIKEWFNPLKELTSMCSPVKVQIITDLNKVIHYLLDRRSRVEWTGSKEELCKHAGTCSSEKTSDEQVLVFLLTGCEASEGCEIVNRTGVECATSVLRTFGLLHFFSFFPRRSYDIEPINASTMDSKSSRMGEATPMFERWIPKYDQEPDRSKDAFGKESIKASINSARSQVPDLSSDDYDSAEYDSAEEMKKK
mmetsp:Transcript_7315/g.9551  ORF Transcript_7315/g.9551 Transcript_7315/m.9551 type:complete len:296 (+) Transcript_7315:834-1721(+)